jgi:hypothetical protein
MFLRVTFAIDCRRDRRTPPHRPLSVFDMPRNARRAVARFRHRIARVFTRET